MGVGGFRVSEASVTLEYQNEPKVVAESIIKAIAAVGKVEDVSRETGVIRAKISNGLFNGSADAVISVSSDSSLTYVKIGTRKPEPLLYDSAGAQKAMSKLMDAISKQVKLKRSKNTGW